MKGIDYNDRFFAPVSNTDTGEVGPSTLFHYRQTGGVVWATYEGGDVRFGTLIATVDESGRLDMRYSHVNRAGELMTGRCESYHRRSLAETAMMRSQMIFSDRLKSREWGRRETEPRVRCAAMNRVTSLGMPQSYPV